MKLVHWLTEETAESQEYAIAKAPRLMIAGLICIVAGLFGVRFILSGAILTETGADAHIPVPLSIAIGLVAMLSALASVVIGLPVLFMLAVDLLRFVKDLLRFLFKR